MTSFRWRLAARHAAAAALLPAVLAVPATAAAQRCVGNPGGITGGPLPACPTPAEPHGRSLGRRDAVNASINVALGALTAGFHAWRHDKPVLRAALVGAAGGAVAYGGKRVMAAPGRYSGLAGRQLGAVGISMIRNAGDGRAPLAGVVLPLGPVRLYVNEPRADGTVDRLQPRLDLAGLVGVISLANRPGASLDLGASFEAGAPVVRDIPQRGSELHLGTHRGGAIGLADVIPPERVEHALRHERVHVAQYDLLYVAVTEPLERALWRRAPSWLAPVGRFVDLGLNQPVWAMLNAAIPYHDRPWEREAYLMTDR